MQYVTFIILSAASTVAGKTKNIIHGIPSETSIEPYIVFFAGAKGQVKGCQ